MNHYLKKTLLPLFLVLVFWGQAKAQFSYSGNVLGQLVWVQPDTGTNLDTFLLEDIQLQLIAVGQGVVASTITGPDGFFDFTVPTFSDPSSSVELNIKIYAINRDTTIMARNTTNTGPRHRTVLTAGQVMWSAGTTVLPIGRVESPTDCRAHSVHFANKAKLFVESELSGTFAFPTAPNRSLYIMPPPFGVNQNFYLPADLRDQVYGILIAGGAVPLGLNSLAAAILAAIPVAFTEFSAHPAIYLNDDESPGTVYHEFGHHLLWHLQGEAWLSFIDAGLSYHSSRANDPSQKLAWTEGFANGFGWIMTALERKITDRDLENWDNNAAFHLATDTIKDTTGTIINGTQVLLHGFAGENYVADFIYDLWDGPNNLALLGNDPVGSPDDYEDGSPDQIELSLAEILQPILNNAASLGPATPPLARFGQEASLLNNVVDYHDALLATFTDCEFRKDLNRLSRLDNLHNLNMTIADSLADIHYMNTDVISYPATVRTRRFKPVDNNNFNFKELKNPDPASYQLDVWGLRDANDSYNVTFLSDPGKTILLSDDLEIGMKPGDPAILHFNRHLNDNFQTSGNTWGAPQGLLFPNRGSHLDINVCGGAGFLVSDDGIVELGDSLEGNTAEVRFLSGTSFTLGGATGSGRGAGKLVINDDSRLVIEEGATLVFNNGSEIYLRGQESVLEINGTWIIEENATFSFTGSGHLETGLPADLGFGNITMGPNSSIVIKGKGKVEHLIWRVKAGTEVVLPGNQPNMVFGLEDGIVELEAAATMKVEDAALSLIDLWVHSPNPSIRNHGIRSEGNVLAINNSDFEDATIGLDIDFSTLSNPSALINLCSFSNCLGGLKTIGADVQVSGTEFAGNLLGWQSENPGALSNVNGCLFTGNDVGLSFTAPQTLPSPILFCQSTTMTGGDTAISQNGFITLNAQCLNIDDYETAVSLRNGGTAVLNGANNCSFQTDGPTWIFTEAFLPDLANGENQYFSSSSSLFTGSVINNPGVSNWNNNHWQAINFQSLSSVFQNITLVSSGAPKVMAGTGMSSFSICGSAPKTNGLSGQAGGWSSQAAGAGSDDLSGELAATMVILSYPQPFSEFLNLRISGLEQTVDAELMLMDLQGRVQWKGQIKLADGDVRLDGFSALPAGTYFLRVNAGEIQVNRRIIKQ